MAQSIWLPISSEYSAHWLGLPNCSRMTERDLVGAIGTTRCRMRTPEERRAISRAAAIIAPVFSLEVFVFIVCFGVPAAVGFFLTGWWWSWRRPVLSLAVATSMVGGCYGAFLVFVPESAIAVTIESPNDMQAISTAWPTIEGVVEPEDATVVVLVHPIETNYWSVQAPVQKGTNGAWRGTINLGRGSSDKHKHFQIMAVATDSRLFAALRGQMMTEGLQMARPPALPHSDIVSVWRAE